MTRLRWGMVGGGKGSQIGPAHLMAARLDGLYELSAGALDVDAERGRTYARGLGIADARAYADWRAMLDGEAGRADRIDLVTIATPNRTHFEISKAFLQSGFDVLCEKPITMTVEEAEELAAASERSGRICAVNYGYTGYPLVRQMRAMVARGDLGRVRLFKAEFAHGFHAAPHDADNPRVRWRYDPSQIGPSAQFADCGIHALHMACFVTGQVPRELSADLASIVSSRTLEDDAMVNLRMADGSVGRLWTSSVATGHVHGLNIELFGEKAGLRWVQEAPNQLLFAPLGGSTQIIERGGPLMTEEAARAARITIGHTEGFVGAFANIYADLHEVILARRQERTPNPLTLLYPTVSDGIRSMAAIRAVVESGRQRGAWVDARPPSERAG